MTYLPIAGAPAYGERVQELVFGRGSAVIAEKRARTAHAPGGTGALRVAADLLAAQDPRPTVWMSSPTWANHAGVFGAAGLKTQSYPYYDRATQGLDFDGMAAALAKLGPTDVVLLHACCHNPTGIDPSPDQWKALAGLQTRRGFFPLFDFAYQGFAEGIPQDAAGVQSFAEAPEMFVASSFSKNFGLYNQRTGALTFVGPNAARADIVFGHLKRTIRSNYSNPPAYGGALVSTVLGDADLRARWEQEVAGMRSHILAVRKALVSGLKDAGVDRDFSYLVTQRGMFSFSGLSDDHVAALRERFGIYIVKGGRINVAGITPGNVRYLCESIATVLKEG
jgi:aspartate/tyrosine/aromatic aminotransferase